jgi:hypothetical protein
LREFFNTFFVDRSKKISNLIKQRSKEFATLDVKAAETESLMENFKIFKFRCKIRSNAAKSRKHN